MAYFARINDRSCHPVESWEQASQSYRAVISMLQLSPTEAPRCRITDADGVTIAHISYDGTVWPGIDHVIDGGIPIYEPN